MKKQRYIITEIPEDDLWEITDTRLHRRLCLCEDEDSAQFIAATLEKVWQRAHKAGKRQ